MRDLTLSTAAGVNVIILPFILPTSITAY
jgi:hypothetical protein